MKRRDLIMLLGSAAVAGPMAAPLRLAAQPAPPDKIRVGNPSVQSFSFLPLRLGIMHGFFAKYGIEVEEVTLNGSAKLHQAMTAGSLDIGLGSGTDLIFLVKGVPEIAVASMAGPPLLLGVVVPYDSPAQTADDLKGKRIGISTVNSLTQWLMRELARQKRWDADSLTYVTVGAELPNQVAALVTGQIDAVVSSSALGLQLAEAKRGRLLFPASDIVRDFMIHTIYASAQLAQQNPDAVQRFLKGWFDAIAFMRAHRDETVRMSRERTNFSIPVEEKQYDLVMPMFSDTGRFDPRALATIQRSFVDLHLIDQEPDLTKYCTEQFLPGR
ncbi:MAG TPA: ABC transporter substrate-binding protein [Xanthobacteraceae bacterium]|jgi:ABC-type nitrate/sulfonate/bicarbonate transport system substrate-binding protein